MKVNRIITITVTIVAVGMVAMSGVMKLVGAVQIVKMLDADGVGNYRVYLGFAEIFFAIIFAWPKSMRMGLLLLTAYFGGAIATEISHHQPIFAVMPLSLIWLAGVLRDKSIFLPIKETPLL